MAAPTVSAPQQTPLGKAWTLETRDIVNQSGQLVISKAISPPAGATTAVFHLCINSMGGTTPLIDFGLKSVDVPNFATPVTFNLGDWDGITQITSAASPVLVVVDVGPNIAADDTGSATASSRYGVMAVLPEYILYTITCDGTTGDEDYNFTLTVTWR